MQGRDPAHHGVRPARGELRPQGVCSRSPATMRRMNFPRPPARCRRRPAPARRITKVQTAADRRDQS